MDDTGARLTGSPDFLASDNAIAMACFGFVTVGPLSEPERRLPLLNSFITTPTFGVFDAIFSIPPLDIVT